MMKEPTKTADLSLQESMDAETTVKVSECDPPRPSECMWFLRLLTQREQDLSLVLSWLCNLFPRITWPCLARRWRRSTWGWVDERGRDKKRGERGNWLACKIKNVIYINKKKKLNVIN